MRHTSGAVRSGPRATNPRTRFREPQSRTCCLWLLRGDVPAASDAVREPAMPPGDQGARNAPLALTQAHLAWEGVAVHQRSVLQDAEQQVHMGSRFR